MLHFYTHVNELLFRDTNSHIFKHLSFSKTSQDNCDVSCFKIIDNATSFYQLKIEKFHIESLKSEFNKQVDYVRLALQFYTFTVVSVMFSVISLVRLNLTYL